MTGQSSGSAVTTFTLPSDLEVVMESVFDAPRDLVFRAFTDRTLIPKWWGPRYLSTSVDEIDLRPGGAWRFVQRDAEGNLYAFHGEYRETLAPVRLVYTFEFEGAPGHVVRSTATFQEQDGKTTLTATDRFESVEDRDEMLRAGMEEGATESSERLAELLEQLK